MKEMPGSQRETHFFFKTALWNQCPQFFRGGGHCDLLKLPITERPLGRTHTLVLSVAVWFCLWFEEGYRKLTFTHNFNCTSESNGIWKIGSLQIP